MTKKNIYLVCKGEREAVIFRRLTRRLHEFLRQIQQQRARDGVVDHPLVQLGIKINQQMRIPAANYRQALYHTGPQFHQLQFVLRHVDARQETQEQRLQEKRRTLPELSIDPITVRSSSSRKINPYVLCLCECSEDWQTCRPARAAKEASLSIKSVLPSLSRDLGARARGRLRRPAVAAAAVRAVAARAGDQLLWPGDCSCPRVSAATCTADTEEKKNVIR